MCGKAAKRSVFPHICFNACNKFAGAVAVVSAPHLAYFSVYANFSVAYAKPTRSIHCPKHMNICSYVHLLVN